MTDAPPAEEVEELAPAPDEVRENLLAQLTEHLGDAVLESHLEPHLDLWVRVAHDRWRDVVTTCRDELGFVYFGYLSGLDWMLSPWGRYENTQFEDEPVPGEKEESAFSLPAGPGYAGGDGRFQVLLRLQRIEEPVIGINLKVDLDESNLQLDSITDLFAGANWHEREAWEFFGFDFPGHPGLAHVYLPTEFEGNPLRKDYPLLAREVKPWPGVVDIEEIPEHLEAQLEAEVMAAFEAEQGEASEESAAEQGDAETEEDTT